MKNMIVIWGGDQKAMILKIRNADVTLSWEIGKAAVLRHSDRIGDD